MAWEPTLGKWFDDENYAVQKPLWKRLLNLSSQYENRQRLLEILSWFGGKNMHGDSYKIRLIGCFLHQAGVDLEGHIRADDLAAIAELARESKTIDECALRLLKQENIDEEFIDEFKTQFPGVVV